MTHFVIEDETIISIIRLVNEYVILKAIVRWQHLFVCIHTLFAYLEFLSDSVLRERYFYSEMESCKTCFRFNKTHSKTSLICVT